MTKWGYNHALRRVVRVEILRELGVCDGEAYAARICKESQSSPEDADIVWSWLPEDLFETREDAARMAALEALGAP